MPFSVASLTDPSDEPDFWRNQSTRERMLAVELMRQVIYGYQPAAARLQRVFATAEFEEFFGCVVDGATPELFQQENKIARMGVPPFRIEIMTTISGVTFPQCYAARIVEDIDGTPVSIISLQHLKANKKASGRHQDLSDLEHLR